MLEWLPSCRDLGLQFGLGLPMSIFAQGRSATELHDEGVSACACTETGSSYEGEVRGKPSSYYLETASCKKASGGWPHVKRVILHGSLFRFLRYTHSHRD